VTAATIAPAVTVGEGHALLHVVMGLPWRQAVETETLALAHALGAYAELDDGAMQWRNAAPRLRDEADPGEAALRKAAEAVASAAEVLIAALAASGGTEGETKNVVVGVAAK
jgi:hypothetical protein